MRVFLLLILAACVVSQESMTMTPPCRPKCHQRTQLCKRLVSKVVALYDQLIYPGPLLVLNNTVSLNNTFAPQVQGLVDPLGVFGDRKELIEYFFVFAASPSIRITQADMELVTCNATSYTVSTRARLFFEVSAGGLLFPYKNVTQSGSYLFATNETVTGTLLQNHLIGYLFDPLVANATQVALQNCATAGIYCNATTDPLGFYANSSECMSYMLGYQRITMDQLAGNTLQCRYIHHFLVPSDPFTHCPHIGKTGGGPCTSPYYAIYDSIVASILAGQN